MSHLAPAGYAPRPTDLLSRAEAEQFLDVSRKTLWRLVRTGQIPVVRIDRRPRFLLSDLETFVQSRRVEKLADVPVKVDVV